MTLSDGMVFIASNAIFLFVVVLSLRLFLAKALSKQQIEQLRIQQDSLSQGMQDVRHQLHDILNANTHLLTERFDKLTHENARCLKEISQQVDVRLSQSFEKTTATFTDVVKRLALIDAAQQRITELSSHLIDLQDILSDKRSRGAFGEVQLTALIRNVIPEAHFALQHTLSNGKRCDCILFLPEPTGRIVIDAKFPLEAYRALIEHNVSEQRRSAEQQFRHDIRKHIQDIASKYIIPGETAEGAMMFIPAEAVFAEIHSHYPELVSEAQKARVWLVSPTTMMAVLTTARAVLKDAATRKQVHIIQEHLGYLSKDFSRFQQRMENLAKHIHQASEDVKEVRVSAEKITHRFERIEKVELKLEESSVESVGTV